MNERLQIKSYPVIRKISHPHIKQILKHPMEAKIRQQNLENPILHNHHIESKDKLLMVKNRRLSTDHKKELVQYKNTFLTEFSNLVKKQKELIKNQIKENLIQKQLNDKVKTINHQPLDILDWVKIKYLNKNMDNSFYDRQYLKNLMNRNCDAMQYFIKNRSELIHISLANGLQKNH